MEDDNYISFLYEKIGDFIDYIKTFFTNEENKYLHVDKLYNDKYISFKIDEKEVDNLINEVKDEIKFDKEFLILENRYNILVKEIKEMEVEKKTLDEEEEDEDDNNNNKPDSGELVPVLL